MATSIKKIEEKVKLLHLAPVQQSHSVTQYDIQMVFSDFWFVHIKPVIDISKRIAGKYGANKEVCWLAAILHDIARLDDLEPHEEIGARNSYHLLIAEGFAENITISVCSSILHHRCRDDLIPLTKEQMILATADALAHFKSPFYFWFCSISAKPFPEQLSGCLNKIERDFRDKIFFKEERDSVRRQYELLKDWFGQKIKK